MLLNTTDLDRTRNRSGGGRNPLRQPQRLILDRPPVPDVVP
jgi:hypothetical protein